MSARAAMVLLVALGLVGCPEPRGPGALIDHGLWARADAADDPFGLDWPDDPDGACLNAAWFVENLGLEPSLTVDLAACSFVVLQQPSRIEVRRGDLVSLRLWHDALFFEVDAGVRLGLALDGAVVWTLTLPAPGDSGLEAPEWEADVAADLGAPVHFFIDAPRIDDGARHGGDSLNLIEWSRRDPRWEPEE